LLLKQLFKKGVFKTPDKYILIIYCVFLVFLGITSVKASPLTVSDTRGPKIVIRNPLPDSVLEIDRPWFEVLVSDRDSGIQQETIRFYLDGIEVSDSVIIEEIDPTGQAEFQQLLLRYRSGFGLGKGAHEVLISLRDKAENYSEKRWRFEVDISTHSRLEISGSHTIRTDILPLAKLTDTVKVNIQNRWDQFHLRLNFRGHLTDYPSGIPAFSYHNYYAYQDHYSLGINNQNLEFLWGDVAAYTGSELLQVSPGIKGGVLNYKSPGKFGKYSLSMFSGECASSSGLGISVNKTSGLVGEVSLWDVGKIKGFYLQLGEDNGYQYTGIKSSIPWKSSFLRFETVQGLDQLRSKSGKALAIHYDRPFHRLELGLDYTYLEEDFPTTGSSISLSGYGSTEKIALRSIVRTSEVSRLNLYTSVIETEEVESEQIMEEKRIYNLEYVYQPAIGWNYNLSYQGDSTHTPGKKLQENNSMLFRAGKDFNSYSFQSSIVLGKGRDYDDIQNSYLRSFSALTIPTARWNLIPSLSWRVEDSSEDKERRSGEVRLTADAGLYPGLGRSRFGVFYKKTEKNDLISSLTTAFGLESQINIPSWKDTRMSINLKYIPWIKEEEVISRGEDLTLNLKWSTNF